MKRCMLLALALFQVISYTFAQTHLTLYPDSVESAVGSRFQPGVFLVPKTQSGLDQFMQEAPFQNSVRTYVIESALNNTTNLSDALAFLDLAEADLQAVAAKCEKLVFIFAKMPPWLSSSSDPSPAPVPGWAILHTRPPANWQSWQTVVDSISTRIVNRYGITNACFEIWNEPDLGYWTGTDADFFRLIKTTYDGVKDAGANIPVGGVGMNYWANGQYLEPQPPYGQLSATRFDSTLLGRVIDSTAAWGKPLDFISFHNFNLTWEAFKVGFDHVEQQLADAGQAGTPVYITEWNASSQVRDTRLGTTFLAKGLLEMAQTGLRHQMIAAWQDFDSTAVEFHQDYGLLTYSGIRKPAYNALALADKLRGQEVRWQADNPTDMAVAVQGDTLQFLVANYIPPAIAGALNHTLFEYDLNIQQLDSAGLVNIALQDISVLDSVYQGLLPFSGSGPVAAGVMAGRDFYAHLDSLQQIPRSWELQIPGISGNYAGTVWYVDSTRNNLQFRYDSLRNAGQTHVGATNLILADQTLKSETLTITNGICSFTLQPNSLLFMEVVISGLTKIEEPESLSTLSLFPVPAQDVLHLRWEGEGKAPEFFEVRDLQGRLMVRKRFQSPETMLQTHNWVSGTYLIHFPGREEFDKKWMLTR